MTVDFHGLPASSIENQHVRVQYLTSAGPRIVGLFLAGSQDNLLAEVPDRHFETPYGLFHIYGGHRFWHAPEVFPRTYVPDSAGLSVERIPDGVRLVGAVEQPTGLQKTVEVSLSSERATVFLMHRLTNVGSWPIEVAPWAITQVPLGGLAFLPLAAPASSAYLPNRQLTIWPYSHWHDSRLQLHDEFVLVHGRAQEPAFKIGYLNHNGWLGYLRDGVFLCKRFQPQVDQNHPDLNCNTEIFCRNRFLELETLAPLGRLEPGQSTVHREEWQIYGNLDVDLSLAGARVLQRLVAG